MAESMIDHAPWLLFVWVLANQAGVPFPVVPSLLAAGAVARSGNLELTVSVAVVAAAALCADLAWYGAGRWRGAEALGVLRRLLLRPKLVDRAASLFAAHEFAFLLGARFLPELNPVAAGLAGATRMRFTRYLAYGAGSALLWGGTWAGLVYSLFGALAADFALSDAAFPVLIGGGLVAVAGSALLRGSSREVQSAGERAPQPGPRPRGVCGRAGQASSEP